MKSITFCLLMMLAFVTASVAQTAVIYETDFDMRALGATIHDQSGNYTESQGSIWWVGSRYNDTGNLPGLMNEDGEQVPQNPADPTVNYMRTGSNAAISVDGIPTTHHFRVSPSQPFVNGGKISITYTVHGGGGSINIYDMTEGGLGLLGSVSTDGDSRVKRTAEFDLPADFNGVKTIGFTRGAVTYFAWDLKIETTDASAPVLSDEKAIISASVPGMESSDVDGVNFIVSIVMPAGTDLTAIAPDFTISAEASISPLVAQDFSQADVVYTVTAEDGTSTEWTVSIMTSGTVSIPKKNSEIRWNVSGNTLNVENVDAGSLVQQISLSGVVVSEGVVYGNNYQVSLISGVQIIRIAAGSNVEVIKVVGK